MKRMILVFNAVIVCMASFPGFTAFAAEADQDGVNDPSNVTITVVMPEPALPVEESIPSPALLKLYPSDVTETREGGEWHIIKTYELNADEKPEDIPRDSFERNGWEFTLADIIRKETANAKTQEHTETVTLNTDTKELEKILPMLAPTMEHETEDGFVGILTLDVSSIKVETAGTKTSSYTMSVTREYPRLSANDTSLVPKTVEDKGKTYTLATVDWQASNTVTVDYDTMPEYYTAVATYTATGTSTKATGYTTTAVYTGTLAKLSQGTTIYTAYFLGEEIRTPLELTDSETTQGKADDKAQTAEPAPALVETPPASSKTGINPVNDMPWLAAIALSALLAGGTIYFIMKRKVTHYETKPHHPVTDAADGSGGDDSDFGG